MTYGKIAVIAAACLLTVPMVAAIRAQAHGEDGAGPAWRRGPAGRGYLGFLAGVQLTDAQRQKMHEIMKTAWDQDKAQVRQLRALRGQIGDEMAGAGAVTAERMDALQQQAAQIGEQLDADRLAVAIQVRGLLTSDQLAQSASIHAQLKDLHEQERALMAHGRSSAN